MLRWLAVVSPAVRHWGGGWRDPLAVILGLADHHNEAPGAAAGRHRRTRSSTAPVRPGVRRSARPISVGTTHAEMFTKAAGYPGRRQGTVPARALQTQGFGMPENRDNRAGAAGAIR